MKNIQNVAVIGGGLMGRQIALNTALHGYNVTLTDNHPDVVSSVEAWAKKYLASRVEKQKMTAEAAEAASARIHYSGTVAEAAKDADLVIEAIVELEDVKRALFTELSAIVREDTIIASNSSTMPSSMFADCVKNPSRLANLHYFNPALVMKLTEVVRGSHTGDETVEALMDFSRKTGKTPILMQKEIDGFAVNNIVAKIYEAAFMLVDGGYCTPQEVDIAAENGLGHPMGPFRLMDLTGVDLLFIVKSSEYEKTGVKPGGYDLLQKMYDQKKWGQKTGEGFYSYTK